MASVEPNSDFIGSAECKTCHQVQYTEWQGSHHQLAMQTATAETVLGDFDDVTFDYFGSETRFVTENGRFYVETDDQSGARQKLEISHTFGVTPLQQYLVDMPGGRKQALQFAWDSRPAPSGGQRWYHLYPDENIDHKDPLHWTGRFFNWNLMCAECHSTNVEVGYDIASNSFSTTFDEISVGCEACHGPGLGHVTQAETGRFAADQGLLVDLDDKRDASWIIDPDSGIAERTASNQTKQQPESCGRCHSRRSVITKDYVYGKPLADTHNVSLLEENLYHADGQIQDEVYVYGSFVQSKMYAAGVTCTDCHNPHSGQLHTGPNPNEICATCHLATRFASEDHAGVDSNNCVDCHMAAKTYMGVDDRRDHSFRLPDTDADPKHYGRVIAAGRLGGANDALIAGIGSIDYPPIARATMQTLLEPMRTDAAVNLLAPQIEDHDPLVRIGALRALRNQPPEARMRVGSTLLRDPVRGVRIEAVLTYVGLRDLLPLEDARAFAAAAREYRDSLLASASMPEALTGLAEFESQMGDFAGAEDYLHSAIRLNASFALARHTYGLLLIRNSRQSEALQQFRMAAELDPENSRFAYVYGIALNSLGSSAEALQVLRQARATFPDDYDIAWGLATILRDIGSLDEAQKVAADLMAQYPDDPNAILLSQELSEISGRQVN